MIPAALLVLTLIPAPVAEQGHPLVGVWQISFAGGMQIQDGTPTPIMRTGRLTVEAKGDSLIATLTSDPASGLPARPPARMAAKAGPGKVTFVQRSTAQINLNGEERDAVSVSTWILDASGDQLDGSVERKIEGLDAPAGGPQPVKGQRAKG